MQSEMTATGEAATARADGHDQAAPEALAEWARHQHHRYAGDEERPLGSYLGISAAYAGSTVAVALAARLAGRRLPERFALGDLVLLTIATHKAARLTTKDPATSWLRAPFTRYSGTGGPSEVHEDVRGSGVRHAVGELVTCPFCMGQWIATAATLGLYTAPRLTRMIASSLAVLAGSDFLQLAYGVAQRANR